MKIQLAIYLATKIAILEEDFHYVRNCRQVLQAVIMKFRCLRPFSREGRRLPWWRWNGCIRNLKWLQQRGILHHINLLCIIWTIVSHLPGGHLPPPKFGYLPPPNSNISHSQKPNICQEDNCHPQFFFFFFWRTLLGVFDLQLMEDIKDGKEEVLDEVVMEHIK